MADNQMFGDNDLLIFLRHYYNNRALVLRVLILVIGLSIVYSVITSYLSPPVYHYTSQSVVDMTISEGAEYQKPLFISYLGSQQIFEESAKSIGLEASYASWSSSIVINSIKDTSQIVFRITATKTEKLVELNRRMVSNTIFQTSNILTGINVQTVEDAELLGEIKEIRKNVSYVGNLIIFLSLGVLTIFGWLTFQVFTDRRIKSSKDIEGFTDLIVIGTIPDFQKLSVSEEMNLNNFLRGLLWKKKK